MGPLSAWVGRAGAATRRNLGDSKGQQGITNLEVSSRFAVMHLGCEIAGVSFHGRSRWFESNHAHSEPWLQVSAEFAHAEVAN